MRVIVLSNNCNRLSLACPLLSWQEWERFSCAAPYQDCQTTHLAFILFSFWESPEGPWRQRKGIHFGHFTLKPEPAVGQQSQPVVTACFTALHGHGFWLRWQTRKKQKQHRNIYLHGNFNLSEKYKREKVKSKTVHLFPMFPQNGYTKEKIFLVLLTASEDGLVKRLSNPS